MIHRVLHLPKNYSFFLFGPRGVGKTTYLEHVFSKQNSHYINLLNLEIANRFRNNPGELAEVIAALPETIQWIIIDEIQKNPALLDEVHRQIELNPKRWFALTGSSARKLKRGQANLLAGRAFTYQMAPLTAIELGTDFKLNEALSFGTLPKVVQLPDQEQKKMFLRSYVDTYMKEEIQQESIVRRLDQFHQFLTIASVHNGQLLSWSHLAQDVGVNAKTIRSYFEIVEDTLLGFFLPAYRRSLRKRQTTHPKFYFFDTGITRALAGMLNILLLPSTVEYGRAFEQWFILECIRLNGYQQTDYRFSYFATRDIEIDLVVERPDQPLLFVEIKSSAHVPQRDLRPLLSIVQNTKHSQGICITQEPYTRKIADNVIVCSWQEGLRQIGFKTEE